MQHDLMEDVCIVHKKKEECFIINSQLTLFIESQPTIFVLMYKMLIFRYSIL